MINIVFNQTISVNNFMQSLLYINSVQRCMYKREFLYHLPLCPPQGETLVFFCVVEKLLRQRRETGEITAKPHAGGQPSRVDSSARDKLRVWLSEQPDLTLAELVERLANTLCIKTSPPNLCKILKEMGLRRKKIPSMLANKIKKDKESKVARTTKLYE